MKAEVTTSANIYPLGAIAYFMLTAKPAPSALDRLEETDFDIFEDLSISE